MLGIHKLDDCGAAQLKADLDYLINVTQALSLPRHALLDHMGALAAMDREAFNATLDRALPVDMPAAVAKPASVIRKFERQFAGIRGFAVTFEGGP